MIKITQDLRFLVVVMLCGCCITRCVVGVPEGSAMWEERLEFSLAQFPARAAVEVLTLHVLLTLGAGRVTAFNAL